MKKIFAGYYQDPKTRRVEAIYAHLPIRTLIRCRWCGNPTGTTMHLIKEDFDYDELERVHSEYCSCICKPVKL
jgi:hypothetical protein